MKVRCSPPISRIWPFDTVDDLHLRFNQRPDTSSDSFDLKLRRQLEGASDATLQLMAEAIFVHFLVVDDIGGKAKRAPVDQVLSWMTNPVEIPEWLDCALDQGLAAGGCRLRRGVPSSCDYSSSSSSGGVALAMTSGARAAARALDLCERAAAGRPARAASRHRAGDHGD